MTFLLSYSFSRNQRRLFQYFSVEITIFWTINAELRSLATVRNHSERLRLAMQREERSFADHTLTDPKERLCQKCKETVPRVRSFLRAGKDKKRNVNHHFFSYRYRISFSFQAYLTFEIIKKRLKILNIFE